MRIIPWAKVVPLRCEPLAGASSQRAGLLSIARVAGQPQAPVQGRPQPQPDQMQPQRPTGPQKPKSDSEAIGDVLDSIFNN